jgi:hypothetical protein
MTFDGISFGIDVLVNGLLQITETSKAIYYTAIETMVLVI